jgi:hypothetical protein
VPKTQSRKKRMSSVPHAVLGFHKPYTTRGKEIYFDTVRESTRSASGKKIVAAGNTANIPILKSY